MPKKYILSIWKSQGDTVRRPTHGIQFLQYDYGFFVDKVLELLGDLNIRMEVEKLEKWNPY